MNISLTEVSVAQIESTTPPQMHAIERTLASNLQQTWVLFNIAKAVGGPFHVIHPHPSMANLISFRDVLQRQGIKGAVYWGKKANKAGAWLRTLSKRNGSVDVASVPEMVHALANGIRGHEIGG
ncbi:hypothetical protein [Neorhizobium galegae]|uniref:hypothetical protein n=1 Tax=Neorhizobium galegae TaxID=399 RepID=UPI001AED2EA9|nr:hypothetical protein [Neorhizobium galegae]